MTLHTRTILDFGFWILDCHRVPWIRRRRVRPSIGDHGRKGRRLIHATLRSSGNGFTLAELIVAATVLTVVMTAVYVGFGSTLRAWRYGESHITAYQDVRTALNIMSREFGCMLGGAEHLFQGKNDEVEFFTVAPPMNVEKGEGPRVLWVHYRFNRVGKSLVREEAVVLKPLPLQPPEGQELDKTRVKLGRKYKFELIADGVRALDFTYFWIPPYERKPDEPPKWLDPIRLTESREGWGLPQGIKVDLTVDDPTSESGKASFSLRTSFRGPTTPYNEKKIGALGGGKT